jgi:aryl-alcohol dehydrogenase-like predicted oxidoreductase
MRYRLLGKSGVRISEVALGTMIFGEDWGWRASADVSARMLDLFADAGGNVIDTADGYTNGTSETILGELLKGRRDRFVLATKFTNQTDPGDPNGCMPVTSSLRSRSLCVPWVTRSRLGKVLYPAVSDWAAWEIAEANTAARSRDWSPFTAVQLRYNLLDHSLERELLPMADAFDLQVFAWARLPKDGSPANTSAATAAG